MYEKPLPVPDAETTPYWEGLRSRKLLLRYCAACKRCHFYPRALCPSCHSDELEWKEASGRGEVYTYTVARRPAGPAFKASVPYVVALIQLEEGPRMMSNILTDDVEGVRIGRRVQVDFDDVTDEITLPKFRFEDEASTTQLSGK